MAQVALQGHGESSDNHTPRFELLKARARTGFLTNYTGIPGYNNKDSTSGLASDRLPVCKSGRYSLNRGYVTIRNTYENMVCVFRRNLSDTV